MYLGIGVHCPARQLLQRASFIHIAELVGARLAWLFLQVLEMYGTLVDTYWCTCFHARCANPVLGDALCEMGNGGFCYTTASYHFASYMHQSVQERTSCNDNGFGVNLCAPDGSNANGAYGCPVGTCYRFCD